MSAVLRRLASRAPGQDFRAWTTFTLLLASLWNSAFGIILLAFVADGPWSLRAAACVGLAGLAFVTHRAFRRRCFPVYQTIAEAVVIGFVLWTLGDLRLGVVLIYQGMFFRPVYRGWECVVLVLSYVIAFLAAFAALGVSTGINSLAPSELITQVLACFVLGAVKFVLSYRAALSQRVMIREQILAKAGVGLVAAVSPAEVHAAALNALQRVLDATGMTRATLSAIEGDTFEVVASIGADAGVVHGARMPLHAVPERFRTHGTATKLVPLDGVAADEFRAAFGFEAHRGVVTLTPLAIRDEFLGLLIVETPAPLPPEYTAGLTALCAEVALALQGARLTQSLQRQASEDPLTQLANRAAFVRCLDDKLEAECPVGVLFIDLDNFKTVNDSLGHNAGDTLLVEVARRLRACVDPDHLVARLGGDEFTILLGTESADPRLLARCIQDALLEPVSLGNKSVALTASIGIAVWDPALPQSARELLQAADLALYAAKARGKAQAAMFEASMAVEAVQRLELQSQLREALERDELMVHYQPLIDLRRGGLAEVEALVRWNHLQRGPVSPTEFIPLAEESGLIVPLGKWVLERACQQMVAWLTRHPDVPLVMAVNLSGRQLEDPRLVSDVREVLHRTGLAPTRLKLEITESVAIADTPVVREALQGLKALGVQLAIDDFGSGNSALRYLQHLAIDTLKIDRSFVEGLGQDPRSTALLRGMVAFAKSVGLSVTGEGVETQEQSACLRALGCDHAQGFLFARPGAPHVISEMLARAEEEELRDAA